MSTDSEAPLAWVTPDLAEGYGPHLGQPQYALIAAEGETRMLWRGGVTWEAPGTPPREGRFLSEPLPVFCRPPCMRTVSLPAGAGLLKLDALPDGQMGIVGASMKGLTTWVSLHNVSYTLT
jgi:hypothetical protein